MTINIPRLLLVAFAAAIMNGCGEKPTAQPAKQFMPEINDENCKSENIAKFKDETMQQAISSLCLRRGSFKPSEKKAW